MIIFMNYLIVKIAEIITIVELKKNDRDISLQYHRLDHSRKVRYPAD